MAFIREIKRGNKPYYYLVESYRDKETGKVRQRNLKYLGTKRPSRRYAWNGDDVQYTVNSTLRRRATPQLSEIDKLSLIFPKINTYFANMAAIRTQYRFTREILRPYALHLYTWRESVNELIKILETDVPFDDAVQIKHNEKANEKIH